MVPSSPDVEMAPPTLSHDGLGIAGKGTAGAEPAAPAPAAQRVATATEASPTSTVEMAPPTLSDDGFGAAASDTAPEVAQAVPGMASDEVTFTIADDLTLAALKKEFRSSAKNASVRLQEDQKRWELYAAVALLMKDGKVKSCKKAEDELASLHFNRLKLGKVVAMLKQDGGLPRECPPAFRSGASPCTALTEREKQDLLGMIRFHARCSIPLTCDDISRAVVSWP